MIAARSLCREVWTSALGTLAVLLLVTVGLRLSGYLEDAAGGRLAAEVIGRVLLLRLPEFLLLLGPLAFFAAVLLTLARTQAHSELVALHAAGLGGGWLLRVLLCAALPVVMLLSMLSLVVVPATKSALTALLAEQRGDLALAQLMPRRFQSIGGSGRVVWAAGVDADTGRLSFVETISVFSCQPGDLGWEDTIVFFNDSERFHYAVPDDLVDPRSGVICFPNNFDYGDRILPEGFFRVTCLANYARWTTLPEAGYRKEKEVWFDRVSAAARRFLPEVDDAVLERSVVARDMFTPRTIAAYTGHFNGAVYGATRKIKDGRTPYQNLFLCGTDQGFLGITGAMLSGISMANRHVLRKG